MPLKNRQMQIPGGMFFYVPATKFKTRPNSSFQSIVDQVLQYRRGNPGLAARYGWSTDPKTVENEVDAFVTGVCKAMSWTDYITEGGGPAALPFPVAPQGQLQRLRNVAVGGSVLLDWLMDGAEAVPAALANARAQTCAACPLNEKGDWTSIFTEPVSAAIRSALQRRKQMNLSTPDDANLGVCAACSCPLALKVHLPLARILAKLQDGPKAALAPNCWIRVEGK
jgi:hypothetical protein